MNLTTDQITTLKEKVAEGAQLNELQNIIKTQFGHNLSFMETRFLISDLDIQIITPEPAAPSEPTEPISTDSAPAQTEALNQKNIPESSVSVEIDQIEQPGSYVSGSVTWSDGQTGQWLINQEGSLDLKMGTPDYQPLTEDMKPSKTSCVSY